MGPLWGTDRDEGEGEGEREKGSWLLGVTIDLVPAGRREGVARWDLQASEDKWHAGSWALRRRQDAGEGANEQPRDGVEEGQEADLAGDVGCGVSCGGAGREGEDDGAEVRDDHLGLCEA